MTITTASMSSTTTTTRAAMTGVLLFEGEVGGASVTLLSPSDASTEETILSAKYLMISEKKS